MAEDFIASKSQKVKLNFVPSEQRRAEYKRTYDRLMERAKGRTKEKFVHERHHIVPKSLGGSNSKDNIAILTYDEHFLAHWLLAKFTVGAGRISMLKALSKMKRAGKDHKNRVVSGWQYAVARRATSEAMALWNKTPEGQAAAKKAGVTQIAFYATPEGQKVAKERGGKAGVTQIAFYATPEGQKVAKERGGKAGATLSAFFATPEGHAVAKERGKKIGAALSAFNATPEGQKVAKERGAKAGATHKARGSRAGENNPRAKVKEEIVRQIRAFEGSHAEAARNFGVTSRIAYRIRKGYSWTHIK